MTHRQEFLFTTISLIAAIVLCSSAMAQTDRMASSSSSSSSLSSSSLSTSPTCGAACSESQMRSTASASSRSLQAATDDVSALSVAAKSNDKDQLRALLQKHGFSAAQLDGTEIVVNEIRSPRDSASGMATGKRQHSPVTQPDGGSTGEPAPASKVTVTITIKVKPPTIIITIRW
jgi:hypothetical protein